MDNFTCEIKKLEEGEHPGKNWEPFGVVVEEEEKKVNTTRYKTVKKTYLFWKRKKHV